MPRPRFVPVLLAIDIGLAVVYLADVVIGRPYEPFTNLIDLDSEGNLPAWYSSILWFCVAGVFWVFAERHLVRDKVVSWLLLLLPGVFLAFSIDEIAEIHEWIGHFIDVPGSKLNGNPLSGTGVFFLVIGLPFVIAVVGLIAALRPYLVPHRHAFRLLLLGMASMLVGAVGVDAVSNYAFKAFPDAVHAGSIAGAAFVIVEELAEMIGATIVLWGGYDLIRERLWRPDFAGGSSS